MKQRFLDTLKMIGACFAVIAFFAILTSSCEDRETRAEQETAMEELRDQVWEEAYQRGYEYGYDVGYDNGYYSALEENVRAMPEVITPSDDFTVYVSRSGTMHLNLKNNRIHITQTMVRGKDGKRVTKDRTKTEESDRYIPIFIPELKEALEAVEDKAGRVVPFNPNSVYQMANKVCRRLGFPEVGQHGLRHSFASLCYSLEVPLRITMKLGGWKNEKVVSDIYTHLDKVHVGQQIAKLEQFFTPKKENAN